MDGTEGVVNRRALSLVMCLGQSLAMIHVTLLLFYFSNNQNDIKLHLEANTVGFCIFSHDYIIIFTFFSSIYSFFTPLITNGDLSFLTLEGSWISDWLLTYGMYEHFSLEETGKLKHMFMTFILQGMQSKLLQISCFRCMKVIMCKLPFLDVILLIYNILLSNSYMNQVTKGTIINTNLSRGIPNLSIVILFLYVSHVISIFLVIFIFWVDSMKILSCCL